MLLGINNFFRGTGNVVIQGFNQAVDTLHQNSPNSEIFLANFTPVGWNAPDIDAARSQIAGIVKDRQQKGWKINFVDLNKAVSTSDLTDGIHLTNTGYQKMAKAFVDAVAADLSSGTPTPAPSPSPAPAPAPSPSSDAATFLSDLNWKSATNGWGPVEKNLSNGEDASGDGRGLTLEGSLPPKG